MAHGGGAAGWLRGSFVTTQIVEVIGRAEQGATRPFICRGDDDWVYFVKGRGAGRRSQICEWIAGQLGHGLGLPIAPFAIVDVPEELIAIDLRGDLHELGAGLAFGSRKAAVLELSVSNLHQVADVLQRDVLAFDWWIRNGDRNLGEAGGNPNLFWDVENESLVVIDHNQAFDPGFSAQEFASLHAFHAQKQALFGDWEQQQHYNTRFAEVMTEWDAFCNTVPPEWWFVDAERTVPTDFDLETTHQLLMRCQSPGFWSLP